MADFLKIEDVLDNLDLNESMSGAEFGCGSADFAIALAKRLSRGKIYALDIQEEKLSALKGKLSVAKVGNVHTILSDLEAEKGSTLENNSMDVILIPNVLFQSENKTAIIKEAERVLKSGGELLIIDWLKKTPFNQKQKIVNPEEVKKIADNLRFSLKKEFAAGDYHYALLFTKK